VDCCLSALALQAIELGVGTAHRTLTIKATISIDNTKLDASGVGYPIKANNYSFHVISFNVAPDYTNAFLKELAESNWLLVDFTQGNEPRWAANLIGTRETAKSFANCVITMGGLQQRDATQPFNPKSVEPAAANDTIQSAKATGRT
jgi:predicted homoserine dehydrogenase-like protein